MKSKVIYDWVSFTSKIHSPEIIMELLGLDTHIWDNIKGARGYKDRYYLGGISIHYNGADNMGVWCEMSGQGCRYFESFGNADYNLIFQEIHNNKDEMNLTRLDIAFDDHDKILNINTVAMDTLQGNYISKSKEWEVNYSSKGTCIYIGSPKSDVLIRIYDKAKERGFEDDTVWTRVELQLRDNRALLYTKLKNSVGENFRSVLHNYLKYVIPDNDTNKSRWNITEYWDRLLLNASKQSIFEKVGVEYNIYRCEDYVVNQAGNAVSAMIEAFGVDEFINKINSRKTMPNEKYKRAVKEYKESLSS